MTPLAFELKDTSLPLVTVVLHQADVARLVEELQQKLGETPNFFDDDPVVIDLAPLRDEAGPLAFADIMAALREHRMRPALVTGGNVQQMADALAAGLPAAPEPAPPSRPRTVEVEREVIREVVREVPVPADRHAGHRQAAALGPAGLCARRRPGRARPWSTSAPR